MKRRPMCHKPMSPRDQPPLVRRELHLVGAMDTVRASLKRIREEWSAGAPPLNWRGGHMVGDDRVMMCLQDGSPDAPHTALDALRQSAHPLPPQGLHGPRGRQGDRQHLRTARLVESQPSKGPGRSHVDHRGDRPRGEGFDERPRADVRPSPGAVRGNLGRMSGLGEMANSSARSTH